jgi:hypothetical protein
MFRLHIKLGAANVRQKCNLQQKLRKKYDFVVQLRCFLEC